MEDELLEQQGDVIDLLESEGWNVEGAELQQFDLEQPTTGTLDIRIALALDEEEPDDTNPYRVS